MRVFGGGEMEDGKKYPSLKVCDEIDTNTKIIIQKAGGKSEVVLWSTVHKCYNPGWALGTKFEDE